jgi:hypothetical protein
MRYYIIIGGADFIGSNLADTVAPSMLELRSRGTLQLAPDGA